MGLCLPWYQVPILGLQFPAFAWNKAGLAGLVLLFSLALRTLMGPTMRWAVRVSIIPAAYFWWTSLDALQAWGMRQFGPLQLKLASLNSAISKVGGEPLEVFDVMAWKTLEPNRAFYLMGGSLALVAVLTLLDRSAKRECPTCTKKCQWEDAFCHGCGKAFEEVNGCRNCGENLGREDKFCRSCGREAEK